MCQNFNPESFIQDNFDISTKTSREKIVFCTLEIIKFYLFIIY